MLIESVIIAIGILIFFYIFLIIIDKMHIKQLKKNYDDKKNLTKKIGEREFRRGNGSAEVEEREPSTPTTLQPSRRGILSEREVASTKRDRSHTRRDKRSTKRTFPKRF